jgi:uncharacterized protein (DUF697 family)
VALDVEQPKTQPEMLERGLGGDFDRSTEPEKAKAVVKAIRTCSTAVAVLSLQPFPIVDSAVMIPMQFNMVQAIGRIHGYVVDVNEIRDRIFKAILGRLIALHACLACSKFVGFIPIVTDVFEASLAYALTSTIGELADGYFRSGRTMPRARLAAEFDCIYKRHYGRVYRQQRNELKALWGNPSLRRQVDQLKAARRNGMLSEEEFEDRFEELLKPR